MKPACARFQLVFVRLLHVLVAYFEFDDRSASPKMLSQAIAVSALSSKISRVHWEHLQAVLGHRLPHTADNIQQAALASDAEEHAPRDGRRDAFDTVLQGVVQVSQDTPVIELACSIQRTPASFWQITRRLCCSHSVLCALHHAVYAQNKQWHNC